MFWYIILFSDNFDNNIDNENFMVKKLEFLFLLPSALLKNIDNDKRISWKAYY